MANKAHTRMLLESNEIQVRRKWIPDDSRIRIVVRGIRVDGEAAFKRFKATFGVDPPPLFGKAIVSVGEAPSWKMYA